jgi:hypothetical protein
MGTFDLNNRVFVAVNNSANGEVDADTIFYYHQDGPYVWATYKGGRIRLGQLIGSTDEHGELQVRYQHINLEGDLMTGISVTVPELLPDGRIRLREYWRWTCGDCASGESVTEEIRLADMPPRHGGLPSP